MCYDWRDQERVEALHAFGFGGGQGALDDVLIVGAKGDAGEQASVGEPFFQVHEGDGAVGG